jgi:hypothetical protein
VNAVSTLGGASISLNGFTSPPAWSTSGYVHIIGPGYAVVPISSNVILTNGGYCTSHGPIVWFN